MNCAIDSAMNVNSFTPGDFLVIRLGGIGNCSDVCLKGFSRIHRTLKFVPPKSTAR